MHSISSGLPTTISHGKIKNPEQRAQFSALSAEYQTLMGELFHAAQALHTHLSDADIPKSI